MINTPRRTLLLAATAIALGAAPFAAAQAQGRSIIDTLNADGRFTTFVALIGRAGFTDQLRGPGPVTVFAPTDEALGGAGGNRLQEMARPSNGGNGGNGSVDAPDFVALRSFLEYHAVSGLVPSSALMANQKLKTLNGQEVQVVSSAPGAFGLANPTPAAARQGAVMVGETPAAIVGADIIASNGIIHVINGPLFP